MSDLFNKRMNVILNSGSLGGKLLEDSDIIDSEYLNDIAQIANDNFLFSLLSFFFFLKILLI